VDILSLRYFASSGFGQTKRRSGVETSGECNEQAYLGRQQGKLLRLVVGWNFNLTEYNE